MKLIRFGDAGSEQPGVIIADGNWKSVAAFGEDYNESFFATDGLRRLADWLKVHADSCPSIQPTDRLGPPIARPSKMICIGLNYGEHARESGMEPPKEPVVFFKATSAIVGPNDQLKIPRNSEKTDWEVELAVVIGKKASYVEEADALDHVAGYMIHNDYSERAFQLERSGQWVKGKSCDTFAPLGPYMATPDELGDIHNLRLWLKLNGEIVQDGNTRDLIFNVPHIISYLSQFMTLLPGDVISTGTPSGVGAGMKPPRFLRKGDIVELGIAGLGSASQEAT